MGEREGVGVRADCSRVTSSETGFEKKDDKGRDRSPTPALTVGRGGSPELACASPRGVGRGSPELLCASPRGVGRGSLELLGASPR